MVKSKSKIWFDVKNTIINIMLEILSPNRCKICNVQGTVLCQCCKKYVNFTNPSYVVENKYGFKKIMVGGIKEGTLSEVLKEYKYKGRRDYVEILVFKVEKMLKIEKTQKECQNYVNKKETTVACQGGKTAKIQDSVSKTRMIIVPLPTVRKHIRERGFDHIQFLVKSLKGDFEVENILVRNKNTVQVGQDARKRLEQAKKAYMIDQKYKIRKDVEYILFDDVWTTGASMKAALEVMKKAGIENVSALVVMSNNYIE